MPFGSRAPSREREAEKTDALEEYYETGPVVKM